MPFVLYLLRCSKRLKKIKIILKRLKEKIRKVLRSQKTLKKGTLQNYFSPCFYPEYYLRIYTKTATKHKLLLNKDWQASLILIMWFNYVILKLLYFWGLRWWQILILGSSIYLETCYKNILWKHFLLSYCWHICVSSFECNCSDCAVKDKITFTLLNIYLEKGSGFHMSVVFTSELLKKFNSWFSS